MVDLAVSINTRAAAALDVPLFGDNADAQRAREAGLNGTLLQPHDRSVIVDLVNIVHALLGNTPPWGRGHVAWPQEAWQLLRARVDEKVWSWVAARKIGLTEANVPAVVDIVVQVVREVLAPARAVPAVFAPVAVLLGPRLRELHYRSGRLTAAWLGGQTSSTSLSADAVTLADMLTPRWSAPYVVQHEDGRTWDPVALRSGETVAWHELSDRSVLEIAAFSAWCIRYFLMIVECRRDLGFALAEAAYRDLLPTPDDLRIACDLAEAQGVLTPDAIERWTLVELWARCMPLLWAMRGDRTL